MTSYTQAVWGIAMLAVVRFLNAAKPSEPHIVPFLLEEKGFTSQQVRRACNSAAIGQPEVAMLGAVTLSR